MYPAEQETGKSARTIVMEEGEEVFPSSKFAGLVHSASQMPQSPSRSNPVCISK